MDKSTIEYDAARKRIFDLLKENKITQREFAEKLQLPPQTITDWKKGKSNSFAGQYGRIAPILHTTTVWLAFGNGTKHIPEEFREEILQQQREDSWSHIIRMDLEFVIDNIPDEKLNYTLVELLKKLVQVNSEDWDLLDGIMSVMIAKGKHSSDVK